METRTKQWIGLALVAAVLFTIAPAVQAADLFSEDFTPAAGKVGSNDPTNEWKSHYFDARGNTDAQAYKDNLDWSSQLTSNVTVGDVGTGGFYPSGSAVYSNPGVNAGNSFFVFMFKDTGGRVARVAYGDFDRTQTLSFDYAAGSAATEAYVYAVIEGAGGSTDRQIYLTEVLAPGTSSCIDGNTEADFTVTAWESFSVDLDSSTDWYATTEADFLTDQSSNSISAADMTTEGSPSAFKDGSIIEVGFISYKGNNAWSFAVDDVSVVPEPATMSLLAIGGVALLRRKRNS